MLTARVSDRGPGILDLKRILNGTYKSKTGMGLGIVGARRLMDGFLIESAAGQGRWLSFPNGFPRSLPGHAAKARENFGGSQKGRPSQCSG